MSVYSKLAASDGNVFLLLGEMESTLSLGGTYAMGVLGSCPSMFFGGFLSTAAGL